MLNSNWSGNIVNQEINYRRDKKIEGRKDYALSVMKNLILDIVAKDYL